MIDILTSMLRHVYASSPTTEEMDDAPRMGVREF